MCGRTLKSDMYKGCVIWQHHCLSYSTTVSRLIRTCNRSALVFVADDSDNTHNSGLIDIFRAVSTGSLITSRTSCVNLTGFPFVSVLSTNWRWRSTGACMDWRLCTWLLTVCLWRLCQADDISDLLSPAASLSPGQWPLWAVGTLQSLEPKYGTVYLSTYDSSLGHCVHSDIN